MPYNGSGTFTLPAGNPVVTGTTISSVTTNNTNNDLANGLTNAITRNGQSPPTANLPMGGFHLTGLGAGTSAGDSVEYGGSPSFTDLTYTGTLTGSTGILNIGSGQLYKDSSGNVGIGTSSPTSKLDVYGGTGAATSLVRAATGNNSFLSIIGNGNSFLSTSFDLIQDTSNLASINQRANAPMAFYTANIERMRIDASGNVGIGTSSPAQKLHVNGNSYVSGTTLLSDAGFMFNSDGAQDTGISWASDGVMNVRCNASTVGQFNSTGFTGNAATATNATTAANAIGQGQTWQDVSGSRFKNTTYTNSTGRSIEVYIQGNISGANVNLTSNGVQVGIINSSNFGIPNIFIVPNGGTYIWASASGTITAWSELR